MMNLDDIKEILKALPVGDYDISEDVSLIIYRVDSSEYNDKVQISRHIDIETIFGDKYEIHENEALFENILLIYGVENKDEDEIMYRKYM